MKGIEMVFRAKMKVDGIEARADGGGNVTLSAVISGSPENESFFRWTPAAQLQLGTINECAFKMFELGKEYYIDITSAT